MSDALNAAGLVHEQVGFTEAHTEALSAQLTLVQYALGQKRTQVRRALAVFVTACLRGRGLSDLARQMLDKSNPALERALRALALDLRSAGSGPTADIDRLAELVTDPYTRIGTFRGQEAWLQAAPTTRRALRLLKEDQGVTAVAEELHHARDETLVGDTRPRPRPAQVMNLHQTKGREADTTILLLADDEGTAPKANPSPTAHACSTSS
ncbi:hypothetical protein [Streptomyces sp. NPDC001250]|uniref:hypothetical protein n=1 Tax=unclassified Streptomyces TaxID=2593676 RepID=UPI0033190B6A